MALDHHGGHESQIPREEHNHAAEAKRVVPYYLSDDGTSYENTKERLVSFKDSANLDAFSRLRVSNVETLFDSNLQYDLHRVRWEDTTAGSATVAHRANEGSARLTVTASASDSASRQSREYIRYQPGKSQIVLMTFVMGAAVTGVKKRIGLFDANDGIFLNQTAAGALNIVRRTSTSGSAANNTVAQASWNIDPFDGTGPSGVTLDLSKTQIMVIDFQWLGVGRVRVGFDVDGKLYYAHEFLNANSLSLVYMKTANLPVRFDIESDGTNGASMDVICCSVMSEGGFSYSRGMPFSANMGSSAKSVGNTRTPLVTIRPKSTFNSIVNRGLILPRAFSAYSGTAGVLLELVYGGNSVTGVSWTGASDDSIVEYDVSATAISGGILMQSAYINRNDAKSVDTLYHYPMFLDAAGSHPTSPYTDQVAICALKVGAAGTLDMNGSIDWTEYR